MRQDKEEQENLSSSEVSSNTQIAGAGADAAAEAAAKVAAEAAAKRAARAAKDRSCVALDGTGGDHRDTRAVVDAVRFAMAMYPQLDLIIFGSSQLEQDLLKAGIKKERYEFRLAQQTIPQDEPPRLVLKNYQHAAMVQALACVRDGEADSMISSGGTGPLVTLARHMLGVQHLGPKRTALKARIAQELVLDLKDDNVIYAEVRFAPLLHTKKGLSKEEVVEAVLEGLKDNDLKVNLILCMMRHFSFEDNLKTIELASKYLDKGVIAVDLAGAEAKYPTANFERLFQIAKDKNIPFTIHAGEADGKDSILSAISFKTKRIGHGVGCIEDNEVLNLIKENNITLEVCPTSNIQTNIFENYYDHPIKKLYDMDILVTINVDNMTVSNINLTQEYEKLVQNFNFTLEDLKKMNINAINAAFLSDELKEKYRKIINFKTNE